MMETKPNFLEGNAYHEAGHAVVGWALRLQVGEITIRADRPGESTKIAGADQLPLVDQLAFWAAGRAAEKLFRRQLPVLASADDLENAFHLLASMGIRATLDVNAVFDGGRARARELLREHEQKVHEVAARLIEVRRVDASEFEALMRAD